MIKLDDTTTEVCAEIEQELRDEGIEMSRQEIVAIVSSQFKVANIGFKKGLNVRLPFFGSFVRKFGAEKGKVARELKAIKHTMTDEVYKAKVLENQLANKEKTRQRRATDRRTKFTIETLRNTPSWVKTVNTYDKFL